MKRVNLRMLVGGIVALGLCAGVANALHRDTPVVLQVTPAASQQIGDPSFAFNSTVLLFHSDGDQLSNGNTTPQIFLFDLTPRAKHGDLGLYQLTFAQQGSYNPSAARRGRVLSFESEADLLGNGSIGRQLFAGLRVRWRRGLVPLMQVTRTTGQGYDPELSGTGKYLVFTSDEDLTEEGVAPGPHLYRSELRRLLKSGCPGYPCPLGANPGLRLVTSQIAYNAAPDRRGERVAFDSTGDAAGNNCANGASQIFVKDFKTGAIEQLTFGGSDSADPVFSRDGNHIFFASSADLLGNGNANWNIFRVDVSVTPRQIDQLTFGTDGDSTTPEPNGRRGNRVFFKSDASLTGAPAGTVRLYLYDEEQGAVRLTNGQSIDSSHTAQFLFTSFVSTQDLVGNGNTAPQLFLVNAFSLLEPPVQSTPQPSPTPTVTPVPGKPVNIGLALLADGSGDNGDNTLTTIIAGTVSDFLSNPVPDGTEVFFRILDPTIGAVISNGETNMDPTCDYSRFVADTGITILNQPGVAHVCLTYPGAQANSDRGIEACAGGSDLRRCTGGDNDHDDCIDDLDCPGGGSCDLVDPPVCEQAIFTLPLPPDDCHTNGQPCSDANPCTVGDVCGGGVPGMICVGGANNGGPCTSPAQCPDLRQCLNGTNHGGICSGPIDCPEGGTCVLTSVGSCEETQPPTCQSGTPTVCGDDGNLCTQDICNFFTGACGMPTVCLDDGNPCTNDVCDPGTGACGMNNTDPCEDGDICTLDDICGGGACVSGAALTCSDDLNPCTDDVCNPDTGTCGVPIDCVCP
jgi:hypothetical protein